MRRNKQIWDENAYCMLKRKCDVEISCEFCDNSFSNRYDSIIHNIHHIVIPLFKQEVHTCTVCSVYFKCLDDLVNHIARNHKEKITELQNDDVKSIPLKDEIILIDDEDDDIKNENNDVKYSIDNVWSVNVDKKVTVPSNDGSQNDEYILPDVYYDIKISPTKVNGVSVPNTSFEIGDECKNFEIGDGIIKLSNNKASSTSFKKEDNDTMKSIINNAVDKNFKNGDEHFVNGDGNLKPSRKLVFENDDGILMEDLNEKKDIVKKPGKKRQKGQSIHYDKLLIAIQRKCRYCGGVFPNRFTFLQHELTHISVSQPAQPKLCVICEKYIANTFAIKEHYIKKHKDTSIRQNVILTNCPMCNFKYFNFKKHLLNYHTDLFENKYNSDWNEKKIQKGRIYFSCTWKPIDTPNSNIAIVCHLCAPFLNKNTTIYTYSMVGTFRQWGCRQKCFKCKKYFFEVLFVNQKRKHMDVSFANKVVFEEELNKKKTRTNKDRLKNIQLRLKKINKLSRFYNLFYSFIF